VFGLVCLFYWFRVGEITQGSLEYLYSRSPLCKIVTLKNTKPITCINVGEITQGSICINSRSPLYETGIFFYFKCSKFTFVILHILWFRICDLWILPFMHFDHFVVFGTPEVCHGGVVMHSGWVPPILYIYSLGHFLTTKGALIDGDGYPPKNPKKGSKNHSKMINFHSNLVSKKCQKTCFLMANRTFSLKLITIDQKVTKNHQKLTHI